MEMTGRRSLLERMVGAAMLNVDVYEEVERDEGATAQAAIVVGIAALAAGIGGAGDSSSGFLAGLIAVYLGWLLWSGITFLVGDKLLGGTATWGELLRTLGFAQAPGVFLVLGIIPILGGLVRLVVGIWMLVLGIIAIRQALDFGTGKAVLTALIGWVCYVILAAVLGMLFGISTNVL